MIDKKTHNQTGQDCNFTSKVPNTSNTGPKVYHNNYRFKPNNPGPGEYKITQTMEEATNQHKRANSEGAYIGQEPSSFGTKTKIGDFWKNEGETPFTKQTYHKNPGPGTYNHEKKKDAIKDKIIQEEAVHVAFASTEIRPVNKKVKSPNPGPGTYINIKNPLHCSIKGAQDEAKMDQQDDANGMKPNPFLSSTQREAFWQKPREGPDPGAYTQALVQV